MGIMPANDITTANLEKPVEGMDELEDDFALKKLIEAVENQISEGHPHESGLVLLELLGQGLERQAALALMAETLAQHIATTFATEQAFDVNNYARALLALTQK